MNNSIFDITPFTLLDYPDKTACIIWFAGCNMRCKYCYNEEIVRGKERISYDEALRFLDSRNGLLDGVVLSGGECMLHKDIEPFVLELKRRNFLVKIDTNGSKPRELSHLIQSKNVDYVALDFKALSDRFYYVTQSDLFNQFEKTLALLISSTVDFEVRTTIHTSLIEQEEIHKMVLYLERKGYRGTYYIQNYFNQSPSIGELGIDKHPIRNGVYSSTQFSIMVRN